MQYTELLLLGPLSEKRGVAFLKAISKPFPHKKIVHLFIELISMLNQCGVTGIWYHPHISFGNVFVNSSCVFNGYQVAVAADDKRRAFDGF